MEAEFLLSGLVLLAVAVVVMLIAQGPGTALGVIAMLLLAAGGATD